MWLKSSHHLKAAQTCRNILVYQKQVVNKISWSDFLFGSLVLNSNVDFFFSLTDFRSMNINHTLFNMYLIKYILRANLKNCKVKWCRLFVPNYYYLFTTVIVPVTLVLKADIYYIVTEKASSLWKFCSANNEDIPKLSTLSFQAQIWNTAPQKLL